MTINTHVCLPLGRVQLMQMKVLDLRSMARSIGVGQGGPKALLVQRITTYYTRNKPKDIGLFFNLGS